MNAKQMELFTQHREWAEALGGQMHDKLGDISCSGADDFRQLALMGLLDAIRKFRPDAGHPFKHYAYKRIRGYVRDELRKLDDVGRSQRDRGQRGCTLSLETEMFSDDSQRLEMVRDILASPATSDRRSADEAVRMLLEGLSSVKRSIVFLVHVMEFSYATVACILGLEVEQVQAMHDAAMEFLQGRKTPLAAYQQNPQRICGNTNEGSQSCRRNQTPNCSAEPTVSYGLFASGQA